MLEVVFSDSAAGSMALAMDPQDCIGGAVSVIFCSDDGSQPSEEEINALQQEAQEHHLRSQAEAVPLGGSPSDILNFSLALSVGEIDEEGIGAKREAALKTLMSIYPQIGREAAQEQLKAARKSLSTLLRRAKKGEPIRVWSSRNADEACGLFWLMEQLAPVGFENLDITLVTLPDFAERPDHTVVRYQGWGEAEPYELGQMARLGVKLPENCMWAMANSWRQLRSENAPLRAVLGGRLVSMPETLYDSFILRELQRQPREFVEAQVVGSVLGKYQLGIGDGWVALRIEQFLADGLLEIVTEPPKDAPVYHRYLRKTDKLR